MVSQLVTDPEGFIGHQADFGGGAKPFYVVLVGGVGLALYAASSALALGGFSGYTSISTVQTALLASIGANLIRPLVLWVIFAVGFYAVSMVFGGRGSIADVFKLTGWGFLPFLPMGIVWGIGRYLALRDETLPPNIQTNYLSFEIPGLNQFNAKAAGEPVFLAALVVGFLFLAYSGYIWTVTLEETRELNRTQAAISVAIPVVLWVLYFLQRTL
ncbi:MAG: Yip1 family protein [Halobacteriales archaeon]